MKTEVEICETCGEDVSYDIDDYGHVTCNMDCKCFKKAPEINKEFGKKLQIAIEKLKKELG